jgi:hypothetical protein
MAPVPIPRSADRLAVTGRINEFAAACDVRGSRPMGCVADLSNIYRGTLQGCYPPVNRAEPTFPLP